MIISLTYFKGSFVKHALIQVRWYEFARQVLSSRDVEEIVKAFPSWGKQTVSCILESVPIAGFQFVVESQEGSSGRIIGHWKFQGGGGLQKPKLSKESMKQNWNFQRGVGCNQ